jgi:alkanesulfonate monooxygenase
VEKQAKLDELLHPDVGLSLLSTRIGHDLSGFPLDGPLPELPENKVISSRSDVAIAMARSKNMTIRQLYEWFARQRGHAGFVGTPTEVVDQMEAWFDQDACDGFNFLAPVFPIGLNDYVDLVVPEMQRRGIYRTAYEGPTLRDILELPVPESRYARGSAARNKVIANA